MRHTTLLLISVITATVMAQTSSALTTSALSSTQTSQPIGAALSSSQSAQPTSSQTHSTPLPLRERQGGGSESSGGGSWSGSMSSLTLSQLKDSALQHNFATRAARIDIEAAKEQRKEAFTNYFPNVSGTAMWFSANKSMAKMDIDPSEYITPELGATLAQMLPAEALMALNSPMTMTMMKNGTIAGIEAILPVFTGGQIINGNKLARLGEEVSRLKLRLSEREVEAQTEQYYWQLISLQEKERTLDAVDSLLATIAKDAQTAVEAGVALRNDLLQVQLRQNEIQSQRLKLTNGQSLLKLLITHYCGLKGAWEPLPPTSLIGENSNVPVQGSQTPSTLPLEGERRGDLSLLARGGDLSQLPEYQLLERGVEAAELQRKMELGKRLPSVAVGAGYNYHNLLDNDRAFGLIFATASVPITDWWGGSHALKRKKLEVEKAREQLAENAELLDIRAQKTWNDVIEAQSQLGLAQRSIEQASENLRIHQDTYHAGTATMSDLLQAQLLLQQAQDQHTDAFIALQNALLAHRQATGI